MDKSNRMSKMKARLQAAEGVLKKCEEKLQQVEKVKREKFSQEEMEALAKEAAEGLDLTSIDELRSMKMAPPPVVELVARCVCTLASGDDLGDAEHRASMAAKEARASSTQRQRREVRRTRPSSGLCRCACCAWLPRSPA